MSTEDAGVGSEEVLPASAWSKGKGGAAGAATVAGAGTEVAAEESERTAQEASAAEAGAEEQVAAAGGANQTVVAKPDEPVALTQVGNVVLV